MLRSLHSSCNNKPYCSLGDVIDMVTRLQDRHPTKWGSVSCRDKSLLSSSEYPYLKTGPSYTFIHRPGRKNAGLSPLAISLCDFYGIKHRDFTLCNLTELSIQPCYSLKKL